MHVGSCGALISSWGYPETAILVMIPQLHVVYTLLNIVGLFAAHNVYQFYSSNIEAR
jgi:hypothetical protein